MDHQTQEETMMIQTITAQDVEASYEAAMAEHLTEAHRVMAWARPRDNRYGHSSAAQIGPLEAEAREILARHQQMWSTYAARCRAIHGAPDPGPAPSWAIRTTGPAAEFRAFMNAERILAQRGRADWLADMR